MDLAPYRNSLWLAEPSMFQRHLQAATMRPCPTSSQIRARHREWMEAAGSLAESALRSVGVDDREELQLLAEAERKPTKAIRAVKGKVGVIPIYGPVAQRMSGELMKADGTPLDYVNAALDSLVANPSVGAIVLRMDSPGGGVYGVSETADRIFAARKKKPIYAIADSVAASAGYWLASAADVVISTPSGDVGSVGVYRMHIDESAMLEKEGMKVSLIHAGKYKTEFAPTAPLSDEARAEMQTRVDETYVSFLNALKRNRGVSIEKVRDDFGQGRVVGAEDAMRRGMIDRVMSYDQLMMKLTGVDEPSQGGISTASAMQAMIATRQKLRQTKNLSKTA